MRNTSLLNASFSSAGVHYLGSLVAFCLPLALREHQQTQRSDVEINLCNGDENEYVGAKQTRAAIKPLIYISSAASPPSLPPPPKGKQGIKLTSHLRNVEILAEHHHRNGENSSKISLQERSVFGEIVRLGAEAMRLDVWRVR